jgi:hypothetical protein
MDAIKEWVIGIWERFTNSDLLYILKEIFYFLSILLLLLGIRELKKRDKKKPKIYKPSALRTIDNALNPLAQAKIIIIYEEKIEKGVNKMIRWIKNNKGAIATLLTGMVTLASWIYAQVDTIYVLWGIEIVPVILTLVTGIIAVFTNGFTKSNTQEAINQVVASLKTNKVDSETARDIKFFDSEIAKLEKELRTLESTNRPLVETYERNKKYELGIDATMQEQYSKYLKEKSALSAKIASYKTKLSNLKNK